MGSWKRPDIALDLTGQTFGKLTAVKQSGKEGGAITWLFKCECGAEIVASGSTVKRGHIKSCGCVPRRLPGGESNFRRLVRRYKSNARHGGHVFELTEEQFRSLLTQDCFYCEAPPSQVEFHKNSNGPFVYNGIDRVDNSKGYQIDNVVTACQICNLAKRDLPQEVFFAWLERIAERFNTCKVAA